MMVKILFKHPNPLVMAKVPRILDYTPKGKPEEFYEPIDEEVEVNGKPVKCITYTVCPAFGRKLLATQPERYFLLEPDELFIKAPTQDRLGHTTKKLKSILLLDMNSEEIPVEEAKPEEKEVDLNTFGGNISTAKDAVEAHHQEQFKAPVQGQDNPQFEAQGSGANPLARPEV